MRIASLSPATTEILFAIGAEDQIVCIDQFSDWPEAAKAFPHLKDHQVIDREELKKFQPQIVFTATSVQRQLAEELRKEDDVAVVHQDPRSIADVYESIIQIGMLTGREKEARNLGVTLQQGFNAVKRKAALLPKKLKVYCEEWHHPPMASGNWMPEVVKIAGGIPFNLSLPNEELRGKKYELSKNLPSREVSLQEIQQFDPDMIVLSICGAGKFAGKTLLTDRPGWSELRAAKNGHAFVIDDSLLNRPGPRLVEGAQRLYGWMFQAQH